MIFIVNFYINKNLLYKMNYILECAVQSKILDVVQPEELMACASNAKHFIYLMDDKLVSSDKIPENVKSAYVFTHFTYDCFKLIENLKMYCGTPLVLTTSRDLNTFTIEYKTEMDNNLHSLKNWHITLWKSRDDEFTKFTV